MTIKANTAIELKLWGIALSEVFTTTLKYNPVYENVFQKFFMKKGRRLNPKEFLRSTIFEVTGVNKFKENSRFISTSIFYDKFLS